MLASGSTDFDTLAASLSTCEKSKFQGGDLGWMKMSSSTSNEMSDIPPAGGTETGTPAEIINAALFMNKGDLQIVKVFHETTSTFSWSVVQLTDVVTKVSPSLIKRRKDNYLTLKNGMEGLLTKAGPLKYSIETMGCQMNVMDSERMEGALHDLGFVKTENSSESNVVILNTCSIRDHAEQKVYSILGPHALRKRQGQDVSIVVAGCVAQQEGSKLARRFPEIDVVMGPQYSNRLTELLESVADGNQVIATDPIYQMEDTSLARRKSDICAYVNVIYGCNERCTYCVVPNTRGVEQSRTKEAICKEIADLVSHGYKEVTLLGQNIDSWGRDFTPKQKFADLLKACGEVPGIKRVRFLTSHPKYMSRRVVEVVEKNQDILMPCFNIPFQAGDNEILKQMRRGYTRERYLEIVNTIRELLPDAAITGDCIVGFPGETEEQFQETLKLMELVQFEQLNTAAYSPRPHTPAAEWEGQLSEEVKQDRLQRINRLGAEHALARSQRFVGRIMKVLVEDVNVRCPTQVVGRIPHSRLVYFDGSISLKGKVVDVRITEAKPYSLVGELVSSNQD